MQIVNYVLELLRETSPYWIVLKKKEEERDVSALELSRKANLYWIVLKKKEEERDASALELSRKASPCCQRRRKSITESLNSLDTKETISETISEIIDGKHP